MAQQDGRNSGNSSGPRKDRSEWSRSTGRSSGGGQGGAGRGGKGKWDGPGQGKSDRDDRRSPEEKPKFPGQRSVPSRDDQRGGAGRSDGRGVAGRSDSRGGAGGSYSRSGDARGDRRGDGRGGAGGRSGGPRSFDRGGRGDSYPKRAPASKPHEGAYRSPDPTEPVIPAGVRADELDKEVLRTLGTLSGANQEIVARHLVMAGQLLEADPETAYKHAQSAVKRAGRVDVAREAAALTAYATGRYEEALREVRAVRRMRGDDSLRAIEADCERGLKRPEKALQVIEETDTSSLPLDEQVELILVAAGARLDLEQTEVALLIIEDALSALPDDMEPRIIRRLMLMQADVLRALGREDGAIDVEVNLPPEDDPMEILDLSELMDSDVDHTKTPLRGSRGILIEMFDGLVLDLDGVCFAGTAPIDYAAEVLTAVKEGGTKLSFATNNASRTPDEVAEKLVGLGIPASSHEITTSAMNVMYLIEPDVPKGAKILVVGSDALVAEVEHSGYVPVFEATEDVVAVVQGYGPKVDWALLTEAAYAINAGARYYATNLDSTLPTERGMALGNGSLVAAVMRATGKRPEAGGKPHPEIMQRSAEAVGSQTPLAVGDRLETDIAAAFAAQIPSMHVLTGVSSADDIIRAKRGERPDYLALDLRGLQEVHPQPKHHRDGTWTAGYSQPVSYNKWGNPIIDGHMLRDDGDPITISLDTYRALAAASWEAVDDGKGLRVPKLIVVDNDDPAGAVTKANFEVEVPPPASDMISDEEAEVEDDGSQ